MEPVGSLEDLVPVHHAGLDLGDGGMGPVIDDFGAARNGAGLQVIDPHAVTAPDDAVGADAEAAELRDAHVGDVVLGKTGDELGVDAVIGQGDSHVGLAAAEGGVELMGLREAQVTGGGEAKHHFAEGNYFRHIISIGFVAGCGRRIPALSVPWARRQSPPPRPGRPGRPGGPSQRDSGRGNSWTVSSGR